MRIAVVCNDTRGGVQPYVALALGLKRAGHDVRALAPADLASMFAEAGIEVAMLSDPSRGARHQITSIAEAGAIASMRFVARELPAHINTWTRETLAACEGVDVITGGVGGMVVALSVAEKLGVPFIETHLQPVGVRTGAYPGVLLAGTPSWLGRYGLCMSHHLSDLGVWMPFKRAMHAARESVLGLRGHARAGRGKPVLYGFSRHVLEVPMHDARARYVTGYWSLAAPAMWSPPPALAAFLAKGGPVVSIGFGSMASQRADEVTDMVTRATRAAGVRAILLAGWGGLSLPKQTDDVFCADAVPHDWLFPRMAAVVHHGGAGTTGAALRAGVPAIVVPFTMDQPFWGKRVAALGAGPTPIPRKRLNKENLAEALRRTVADAAMHARAAALGVQIRAEDGVANAVTHFERHALSI